MRIAHWWIVIGIPVIVLGLGLFLYLHAFSGGHYAYDSAKWGGFGSYMTFFVNSTNLCIVIYFSTLVFRYNQRRDLDAGIRDTEFRAYQQAIQNPVLTFKTVPEDGAEVWQVTNVGSGPALNIQIGYKGKSNGEWIGPRVKCYSLAKGEFINIDWITQGPDVIVVHYNDIFKNEFVSIVGDDISEVRPFVTAFESITINNQEYNKTFFDSLLNIPDQRISSVKRRAMSTTTSETTRREG